MGPLEASALGGNTPTTDNKGKCACHQALSIIYTGLKAVMFLAKSNDSLLPGL